MTDQMNYWQKRIHTVLPEIEIQSIERHQEGLVNDVLIVNKNWVIRFIKTDFARELMDIEHRLLTFLRPILTLSIPETNKFDDDVLVYPHLIGMSFVREIWAGAPEVQQQTLADHLGQFLWELHSASTKSLDWDVPPTLAPVTSDTWIDIYDRLVEKVHPLLLPHQVQWMETLFEEPLNDPTFFDFEPVLIHGDLVPYHILYDPEKKGLNAVIDFGTAGLGDPATDLGTLISSYGETLVGKIIKSYPDYDKFLTRARFYAQAIELQWVLLGVESGENYWFTAHLGGARDIG